MKSIIITQPGGPEVLQIAERPMPAVCGHKTLPEILKVFWEHEKIYGMGDMEINIYLQRLISKGLITL